MKTFVKRSSKGDVLAKLTAPRLPKILERRRLYRQIDRARKRSIVWISAPPGTGKTTLVAGYARARKLKPLWYKLDRGDADLATFFHYLGLACKKAAPGYQQALPHLTPEYLPGLPVFTRRFFEKFYSRLKPPAMMIFDNYQDVPADAALHDMLAIGLETLLPGITVILISRENPPSAFARLQANRAFEHIPQEEMLLTRAETAGIVSLLRPWGKAERLARATMDHLRVKLKGWAAGVVIVLEQATTPEHLTHLLQDSPPQVLFGLRGHGSV